MAIASLRWNAVACAAVPMDRWLLTAAMSLLIGCTSDGSASPAPLPPVVQQGTIAVSLTPASVTVPPGGSGSVGVSITRGGSFVGPVTLSASGVPAGVSLVFGSTIVSAGAVSTSISLTVAGTAATGTSDINIVGSGTGVVSPATALTVRVQ